MKPKRIILIRHGESEGNVDKSIYQIKPDYAINLTNFGIQQAKEGGAALRELIEGQSFCFYCSPFYRTRQTYQNILLGIRDNPQFMREDPRLREQEWSGNFDTPLLTEKDRINQDRDDYGSFFYRFHGGESCADVYDRVSSFFDTLHRDFQKENFPENTIIVTHGMLIRVFLMRWFHLSVEEFEMMRNPDNCQFFVLTLEDSKYKLTIEYPKHPDLLRKW